MKCYVSMLLMILPLLIFGQGGKLDTDLWCFEKNFMDSMSVNDTIIVNVFAFDNSPIEFKKNGKFRRIESPVVMCGNSRKNNVKLDDLKGTWNLDENVLTMITDTKTMELHLIEQTQGTITLCVLGITNTIQRKKRMKMD